MRLPSWSRSDHGVEAAGDRGQPGTTDGAGPAWSFGEGPIATATDVDPAIAPSEPGPSPDAASLQIPDPATSAPRQYGPPGSLSPIPRQLATQRSASRHVPDIALDWLDTPVGRVRAASARGHMHRYLAEIRQDSFGIGTPDGYLTLAVADGVGSASASHRGSAVAARTSVTHTALVNTLAAAGSPEAAVSLGFLASDLQVQAAEAGLEPRQLSTTLILAAVAEQSTTPGEFEVIFAEVGDSSAWRLRDGLWTKLGATSEEADSPIDTSVESLPLYSTARVWRETCRPGETLALVSDGIGNILPANPDFAAALAELWRADAPAPAQLLAVVDATVKSFDDDRTFVGLRFAGMPE